MYTANIKHTVMRTRALYENWAFLNLLFFFKKDVRYQSKQYWHPIFSI